MRAPMFSSMHERMCADVWMCVGGFSMLIQSVSMMCVINVCVCAHVQKKKPTGSTTNPGGPCSKTREKTNVQ